MLNAEYQDRFTCKSIPGYAFDRRTKAWTYPATATAAESIMASFPHLMIDTVAKAAIDHMQAEQITADAARRDGWQDATPLAPIPVALPEGWTVRQHQVLGFNIGIQLPACALLMEMGTGKTLTTVGITGRRFLDGKIDRMLVVAPASVVPVWPAELEAFADFPVDCRVLEGATKKRAKLLAEWAPAPWDEERDRAEHLQVAVINYEATWRMQEELRQWLNGATRGRQIVADESQRIKNTGARQSKTMHLLGETASDYRLILTGTPVTQHPMDFFSQYKFLDPSVFGKSFATFRARHAIMGGFEAREIVGYRNLDELSRKAHSIAYRVTKAEALDLPEFVDQRRYCELEPDARKVYRALVDDAVAQLEASGEITATNVLTQLLRCSQMTGGYVHNDDGDVVNASRAKLKLLTETLGDALETGAKVVIFARFREEIKAICAHLDEQGIEHGLIWGDTPMNARGPVVEEYQTNPECKVFVAQIQTAGLGITLTSGSVGIFYSLDFSFANYDQARARLHRMGQKNEVTYIHLLARDTVDEAVMKALARKRNVADAVVDGAWKDLIQGRDTVSVEAFARKTQAPAIDDGGKHEGDLGAAMRDTIQALGASG